MSIKETPHMFSFEKLEVWKESKDLTVQVYKLTSAFPDEEKYGFVSQMRRSATSVCSNIAEGCSRTSARDQAHFYQLAYSSLMELLNQMIISFELGFSNESDLVNIRLQIERISNKLNALRKSRLNSINN
ncbi:MAG: four helix bundle protein [Bacteroidetes bacterium]|nr:four helix bundle protein [Bacteroidota bacterium]